MILGDATVYVLTPATVVDHGATVADWDAEPDRQRVDGCSVQPLQAREVLMNRDAQQATWRVLIPTVDEHGDGVRVDGRSRVEFAGVAHNIVGEPLRWDSPSGTLDHIELLCESWTG